MQSPSTNRLLAAMILYGLLAVSSFFTLEGNVRIFLLIVFFGLALKTWTVHERQKLEAGDAPSTDEDAAPSTESEQNRP